MLKQRLIFALVALVAALLPGFIFGLLLLGGCFFDSVPLEEPASSVKTPNPTKAPWYFLGPQEMLAYYDPMIAGIMVPWLIVAAPAAIACVMFAIWFCPRAGQLDARHYLRRLGVVALVSLGIGAFIAWPWWWLLLLR